VPEWLPDREDNRGGQRGDRPLRQRALSADNRSMLKSIRDLWGRATQKNAMKPEVRSMLLDLDGVYERREAVAPQQDDEQDDEPREAAG
jgi:hypothetical protein